MVSPQTLCPILYGIVFHGPELHCYYIDTGIGKSESLKKWPCRCCIYEVGHSSEKSFFWQSDRRAHKGQAKQGLRQPRRCCLWLLTCKGGGWCVGSVGTSPGLVEAPLQPPGLPTHPPPPPPRSRQAASLPVGVCATRSDSFSFLLSIISFLSLEGIHGSPTHHASCDR